MRRARRVFAVRHHRRRPPCRAAISPASPFRAPSAISRRTGFRLPHWMIETRSATGAAAPRSASPASRLAEQHPLKKCGCGEGPRGAQLPSVAAPRLCAHATTPCSRSSGTKQRSRRRAPSPTLPAPPLQPAGSWPEAGRFGVRSRTIRDDFPVSRPRMSRRRACPARAPPTICRRRIAPASAPKAVGPGHRAACQAGSAARAGRGASR